MGKFDTKLMCENHSHLSERIKTLSHSLKTTRMTEVIKKKQKRTSFQE